MVVEAAGAVGWGSGESPHCLGRQRWWGCPWNAVRARPFVAHAHPPLLQVCPGAETQATLGMRCHGFLQSAHARPLPVVQGPPGPGP